MHYYDWFSKTREQQEEYKKKSQKMLCPDCTKSPCISNSIYEEWHCAFCPLFTESNHTQESKKPSV